MAKLHGHYLEFVLGNFCVYRRNGRYYVRSRSSLTRKKVLKSKSFEKTREYASHMATASRMGSEIYQQLAPGKRRRPVYQAITGRAASLLYRGLEEEEVREMVEKEYLRKGG